MPGDFGKAHGDVSQMDTSNPRQELQKIGKLVHKTKGRRRRSIDCPGISKRDTWGCHLNGHQQSYIGNF